MNYRRRFDLCLALLKSVDVGLLGRSYSRAVVHYEHLSLRYDSLDVATPKRSKP